jgi:hypothetical protein
MLVQASISTSVTAALQWLILQYLETRRTSGKRNQGSVSEKKSPTVQIFFGWAQCGTDALCCWQLMHQHVKLASCSPSAVPQHALTDTSQHRVISAVTQHAQAFADRSPKNNNQTCGAIPTGTSSGWQPKQFSLESKGGMPSASQSVYDNHARSMNARSSSMATLLDSTALRFS